MERLATPLVELDRDHPGFRDAGYRRRRDEIARLALAHEPGTPPPDIAYTATETRVWATALRALRPLHHRWACREMRELWPASGLVPGRIAQLAEVSAQLGAATGFRLEPVAGLVEGRTFLEALGDGRFLATQYVRHHARPLYTPEPDVIHELVGHAVLLRHPGIARLNRRFGEVARRASDRTAEALIRVYWFTMEFGVVREGGELRAMGAGLLSSAGELSRFARTARLEPLDLDEVASQPFDPTDYQPVLRVADGDGGRLVERVEAWLDRVDAG